MEPTYDQFKENLFKQRIGMIHTKKKNIKRKSMFMADINNERYINETYKENLQRLRTMVLVKFN